MLLWLSVGAHAGHHLRRWPCTGQEGSLPVRCGQRSLQCRPPFRFLRKGRCPVGTERVKTAKREVVRPEEGEVAAPTGVTAARRANRAPAAQAAPEPREQGAHNAREQTVANRRVARTAHEK